MTLNKEKFHREIVSKDVPLEHFFLHLVIDKQTWRSAIIEWVLVW